MLSLLYVAVGGAIGAVARYGFSGWLYGHLGAAFPWGTLWVNVLGSFLLGFVLSYSQAAGLSPPLRVFVGIGVLGAFTTFSTFSYEAVALLQDGEWMRAGAYTAASVALALAAVWIGMGLTEFLLRARL